MFTDLYLTNRRLEEQASDRLSVEFAPERGDLRLAGGRDNMAQAILNRLLTRQGELADLGHPNFGSRLHTLVGEPNSRRTRVLAALYVRECLAREPRIQEIASITIPPPARADKREVLEIQLVIHLAEDERPLIIRTQVSLET